MNMGIGGISQNQYTESIWAGRAKQRKQDSSGGFAQQINHAVGAEQRGHKVYMKTDDMLYSGGNGSGLSFYIKYAEGSTEEEPTVIAKGVDENGKEFEQTISINEIDPRSATVVEMCALEAYLDVDKNGGLSSLPNDPSLGNMGLHDRADFIDMFRKSIRDMNTLGEKKLAAHYRYSMQIYWDFMTERGKSGPAPAGGNSPFEHWQKHLRRTGTKLPEAQESKSDSEIITQPDGSRTLMITTRIGDTETVMNIRLSGPSVFQRDDVGQDIQRDDAGPDMLHMPDERGG